MIRLEFLRQSFCVRKLITLVVCGQSVSQSSSILIEFVSCAFAVGIAWVGKTLNERVKDMIRDGTELGT